MTISVDDLKAIYATTRDDTSLQVFVDSALLVVNEDLANKSGLSAARKDKIAVYLAAHFVSLSDAEGNGTGQGGAIRRSKLGDADDSYATVAEDSYGFNSTRWGQMAIALDSSGTLAVGSTNNGVKALIRIV